MTNPHFKHVSNFKKLILEQALLQALIVFGLVQPDLHRLHTFPHFGLGSAAAAISSSRISSKNICLSAASLETSSPKSSNRVQIGVHFIFFNPLRRDGEDREAANQSEDDNYLHSKFINY